MLDCVFVSGVKNMVKRIGLLLMAAMIGALCLEVGEKMSIPGIQGVVSPAEAVVVGRPLRGASLALPAEHTGAVQLGFTAASWSKSRRQARWWRA